FPAYGVRFAESYATHVAHGLTVMRPYLTPTTCTLATQLMQDLQARWESQYAMPQTLLHWDAHAANFLRPAGAREVGIVVDWQNSVVGCGIWDVARFCVMSLVPALRRAAQTVLVALYTETLAAHDVRDYPFPRCVADYQAVLPLV